MSTMAKGGQKERPVVIISPDSECEQGALPLQVVALSTSIGNLCPDYQFMVHTYTRRDPKTGLNAPCAVKCNMCREIEQEKVIRTLGKMPDALVAQVVDIINALLDDTGFHNWQ
jgi:mRNA-degrading endonuclease toxin of MazEF toxin-antitoxin module